MTAVGDDLTLWESLLSLRARARSQYPGDRQAQATYLGAAVLALVNGREYAATLQQSRQPVPPFAPPDAAEAATEPIGLAARRRKWPGLHRPAA